MHIDMYTVLVQGGLSALLLGVICLVYWLRDRRAYWLALWSIPFFSTAVAALAYYYWKPEPNLLSIGLGNVALLTTYGFIWQAARAFERRKVSPMPVVAACATWLLLCAWEPFLESLLARVVISSLMSSLFMLLAAYELWRGRDERLASRNATIAVLASTGFAFLSRIPLAGVLPFPLGALPLNPLAQSILNLMLFGLAIGLTILMISLTRERAEQEQRRFAMTDPLTGLANRRPFTGNTERVLRRHAGDHRPVSLLMLDLDHFKSINDRFGHDAGDRVLIRFAGILDASVRPTDHVYRLGGEEFCCVLPGATGAEAMAVAERICLELERGFVEVLGGQVRATVSIGVASTEEAGYDLEELLKQADGAVYEAKARGRNMAVLAGESVTGARAMHKALAKRLLG